MKLRSSTLKVISMIKSLCRTLRFIVVLILVFFYDLGYSQVQKKIGLLEEFKSYLQISTNGLNEKLIQTSDSSLSIVLYNSKIENGELNISGEVKGAKGSNVLFKFSFGKLEGTIVIPNIEKAYKYTSDAQGSVVVMEVNIHSLLCVNFPLYKGEEEVQSDAPIGAPPPTSNVYHLQSLPGVPYVIMLDFDGQYVVNNSWNGGQPIDAQPANVTEDDIINIWKGICEDFTPFNLNITTDEAIFQAAPKGQRMRCIFTPTNFYPNAGGVAYIGSFLWTDDTPCWSFYYTQKLGMEVGSHEVGHTLGLGHDGRELTTGHEEYYGGQNNWAPIMGVGYYVSLTQWSKGEYQYANNLQDDIATIGSASNKFGFKPDDAGNSNATAKSLSVGSDGSVLSSNTGIINSKDDIDVYSFTTTGGTITLTVTPALVSPDLDILLNLTNTSGGVLVNANPTSTLSATVTASLVAGTYFLQIDGTGNGNPFTTGYSDYSTIGAYTISGTIPVGPTSNCTASGTILREYWANVPGYAISGIPVNTTPTGTSQLTSFDGPLNFANTFGARYRGYICPPTTGTYTFWISSDDNSELWLSTDESSEKKVKIASVTGWTLVNEWEKYPSQKSAAISLIAGKKYYIEALHKDYDSDDHLSVGWQLPNSTIERPIPGSRLSPVTGGNNSPIVSITSPSNGQSFLAPASISINANASDSDGSISKVEFFQGATKLGEDATSPYSFNWTNVAVGNYALTAKATDNSGAQTTSAVVNISVTTSTVSCTATGSILREVWTGVTGTVVSVIPVSTTPNSTSQLTILEAPSNIGDQYGTRIRGFICPPTSGNYIFWISSNDNSELWLSTSENASGKVKIASVTGATDPRQWDKFTSQKSVAKNLVAGNKYYIEVLHKEGVGTDHVAVGWQLPNGVQERPIPGSRLSPPTGGNNPPTVAITSPVNGQSYSAPATISINANASDSDGNITKVEFFQGSIKLGEDASSPYSFSWTNVAVGNYVLTAKATDNGGAQTTSTAVNISVTGNPTTCTATGTILREVWNGVAGNLVSDIPTHLAPNSTSQVSIFEGPTNVGTKYGARYRGYICVPTTGNYKFFISSNDNSELWLSTNENPASKVKIASITGYTGVREWTKYASQQSAFISLTAGQKYYIEALHKQGVGGDNLAVGWQLPNGTLERPIAGSRLSPYVGSEPFVSPVLFSKEVSLNETSNDTINVNLFPNPAEKGFITLTIEGYEKTKQKAYIEVRNMDGKVLYTNKISCDISCQRTIINIDEKFIPGRYMVQVRIGDRVFFKKLLIE